MVADTPQHIKPLLGKGVNWNPIWISPNPMRYMVLKTINGEYGSPNFLGDTAVGEPWLTACVARLAPPLPPCLPLPYSKQMISNIPTTHEAHKLPWQISSVSGPDVAMYCLAHITLCAAFH